MTYVNFCATRPGRARRRIRLLAQAATVIFGLYGFTHGWARVLTVMSPQGSVAARRVVAGEDVETIASEGRLTQYIEKREGALARLVKANGIILLDKAAWDAKKLELGDRIL